MNEQRGGRRHQDRRQPVDDQTLTSLLWHGSTAQPHRPGVPMRHHVHVDGARVPDDRRGHPLIEDPCPSRTP